MFVAVDLMAANLVASLVSFALAISVGIWYLGPAVRARGLADALMLLVMFHAFRHIAMQIFSARGVGGLDAPEGAVRTIAFGDLATAVLALAALWALYRRHALAKPMTWLVAVAGTADLVSATIAGIANELTETATDLSWFILAFYVPFLWITSVMLFWQLITRRDESLDRASPVDIPKGQMR